MEIQNIKQISITDYLQQQGYSPARVQGIHFWYCSPLRNESTPSFKVNTERNQWYDFGTGEHGDIIDLVRALQHCTMNEAIELLIGSKQIMHQDFSFGGERKTSKHKLEIISVQSLTNPYLLRYIAERGIPISIANRFCSEVHYNNTNRTYYAIGFANDAGGWEVRSPYFKGCIAPKAITTISKGTDVLQIFEGFMDFLSWQTLNLSSTCDTIVLNSLALLPRIQEKLKGYKQVESFLDNDDAGRKSFEVLKQFYPQIIEITANPKGLAVLHYDTEQSEAQLHKNLGKTLRRAGVKAVPEFYHSLYLASLSRKDRLKIIRESMDLFHHKHGGIHIVVIDGIADLIRSANDETESIAIVDELYRLAGIYNTCIICVLHFVPNGIKLRGHIGSELQRKAAGILSIEKDDNPEYSVVKALKVRDGSPLDVPMMLFGWDKDEDMHVYCGEKSKEDKEKRKSDELLLVIKSAFRTKLRLSYQELCEVLTREMEIKDRTAKKYIAYMKEQRILTQDINGNYQKGELCHT